jgi:hypothetical protein
MMRRCAFAVLANGHPEALFPHRRINDDARGFLVQKRDVDRSTAHHQFIRDPAIVLMLNPVRSSPLSFQRAARPAAIMRR